MFEEKTLIGFGCSHVFAPFNDDYNTATCHERSWVKKLERLGNFKDSVNVGTPGGSNQRSERILMDYLKEHEHNTSNLVIAFGLTDLSRFEFPITGEEDYIYSMMLVGPWSATKEFTSDSIDLSFLEKWYGRFHNVNYETHMINKRLLYLTCFLNKLNVEHYFIELHCHGGSIVPNQFGINLPLINFKNKDGKLISAIRYIMEQGYRPDDTGHFDDNWHEFLAQLFYDLFKAIKNV